MEIERVPGLVDPVVIAAFEGWNDAADAASSVVDHLMEVWSARVVGAIDPDGDFAAAWGNAVGRGISHVIA